MKVELAVNRMKKLPEGALPALETELQKRLTEQFINCKLTIRRGSTDGLTVFGGDKKEVECLVQETWESADEWFY